MALRKAIALAVAVSVYSASVYAGKGWAPKTFHDSPAQVGSKAPEFKAKTLNGDMVSLADFLEKGKPIVMMTIATECPKLSRKHNIKFPQNMEEFYDKYKDSITFLLVRTDYGHWRNEKQKRWKSPKTSDTKYRETGVWYKKQNIKIPKDNFLVDTEDYVVGRGYCGGPTKKAVEVYDPDSDNRELMWQWGTTYIISPKGEVLMKDPGKWARPYDEIKEILNDKLGIETEKTGNSGGK